MGINQDFAKVLGDHGLKVTPQRIAVLKALRKTEKHPAAETIYREVLRSIPGLSQTTVYNTLETFVKCGLISKVKTESDTMRYDAVPEDHHHLISENSPRIEDFFDPELDKILSDYFRTHPVSGFTVQKIQLHLTGDFTL